MSWDNHTLSKLVSYNGFQAVKTLLSFRLYLFMPREKTPRDGGAWWAPLYGVTQAWTQLKRLSSSSIGH